MKNIMLTFSFLLIAGMGYSQLKVITSGDVQAKKDLFVGADAAAAAANLNLGFGRTASGNSSFNLYTGSGAAPVGSLFATPTSMVFVSSPLATAGMTFSAQAVTGKLSFNVGGVSKIFVPATGDVTISENLLVNGVFVMSDKRLKNDVQSYRKGINEVMALNPVTYTYNGKANTNTSTEYVGVIAQELQKVVPEFVEEFTYDEEDDSGNGTKSSQFLKIADSQIKYLLINAIKDQQGMIEARDQKIIDLEEKYEDLETVVQELISIVNDDSVSQTNVTLSKYDLAELKQNVPNPFDGETTISYVIPSDSNDAVINIYDFNGKLIKTLSIAHSGEGVLNVNAAGVPAGSYSYQLVVDGKAIDAKKMIVK